MTGFAKFTPLPLVELYVELQSDEAEISQAYSYNNLISTLVSSSFRQRFRGRGGSIAAKICGVAGGPPADD